MANWIDIARVAWGAAREAWRYGTEPPDEGAIVKPDPRLDAYKTVVSDHLDFVGMRNALISADQGDLARGLALFEEMEQKDPTLASVANTRRTALTGLDWEIVSAAEAQEEAVDRELADEAAAYVREQLSDIETLGEALEDLATAIGNNIAVAELVWEGLKIVEIIGVPSWRLVMDRTVPGQVNVMTADNLAGVATAPGRFVVHIPKRPREFPFARSIMRAQALIYLTKQLATSDWGVFCELFGMPVRVAKYQQGASRETKEELIAMMESMGTRAFGVFSAAVQLEFIESSQRGTAPFEALVTACERTQAKVWLGGHLTSDTSGGTGTYAAGAVQNEVREDLRDDDIAKESSMVRRQIIAPMCGYKFPRHDVPLPHFRRIKPEADTRLQDADVALKWQQAGIQIPRAYAYKASGIPEPKRDEADQPTEPLLEPSPFAMGEMQMEGTL